MEGKLALRAATCLFILAITISAPTMARVLDEETSPVAAATVFAPVTTLVAPVTATTASPGPATSVPSTPATATAAAPTAAAFVPSAPAGATAAAPATATAVPSAPATVTANSAAAGGHPLTFFMHDILGGSNPSARAVTGIVTNTAVNGQLPFGKPNGAVLPVNGGVPLNSANNGIINNNNVPFLTGLGGTTTGVIQKNGNGAFINGGGNGIPFFTGGNLPAGATLEKLLFGTMTVIDDELTEGHESGSGVVGKAQGFYLASSVDGTSQTMAFTTLFKEGGYADSLSFFGVHRTADSESHVAVIGGTGKYVKAKGYATVQTLPPVDRQQHSTDGAETLLQFTVYLV